MKTARHTAILSILESQTIVTQEELATALRKRGFDVTQATVSRDIKELRLIKVMGQDGVYKYASLDGSATGMSDRFMRIFAHSVLSFASAGTLIVLKTISGSANVACEAIDSLHWPEIVGTIAGDNTIFCALRSESDVPVVLEKFRILVK